MGKNKNKGQLPKGAPQINPNNQTSQKLEYDVVGLDIVPPSEWPEPKRRLYGNIELSLLTNPRFRHLTVLPPGCLHVIVQPRNYSIVRKAAAA